MRRTILWVSVVVAIGLVPLVSGCPSGGSAPGGAKTAEPASSASGSASSVATGATSASGSAMPSATTSASSSPFAAVPYRDLVAVEAWDEAARALDALLEPEKSGVVAQFARARVSVGLCTKEEGEKALVAIAALRASKDASVFAAVVDTLGRIEVDAMVCAEKWADALKAPAPQGLSARSGALAARTLARALEATGDLAGARKALTTAIAGGAKVGLPLGALWLWRLRLDRRLADESAAKDDRRRLFLDFPKTFDEAVAGGEKKDSPEGLSAEDWLVRAKSLANSGAADDAIAAVDEAQKLGLGARRIAHEKGWSLYRAHAYTRAAIALTDSAKLGGNDDQAIDDAFHAARATSRSGDDASAIGLYDALAKKHPKNRWGAEAGFLAGNLRFLHGEFKGAIEAFDRYLSSKDGLAKLEGQATNAREARRAKALALLELGNMLAAKSFDSLLTGPSAKDYEKDSFATARISLLRAIALERGGDKDGARAIYSKLGGQLPYGWVDLATRRRLMLLGGTPLPLPTGPIAMMATAPPPPADFLASVGLVRDARSVLPKVLGDDERRCGIYATLSAGWDAYLVGQKLDTTHPPAESSTSSVAWRCAFPTPYESVVAALEAREGLPRGLMHAILRQESAFRVDVVSPAGAVGIAQLMPQTAATTAALAGKTLDQTDIAALQAPFLQLDLCAKHLRSLYVELGADPKGDPAAVMRVTPLVIAAYNAGAGAVKRWLSEAGTMDADVFVERIPFLETRAYTARVYGNLLRYSILAGAPLPQLAAKFAP